MPSSPDRERKFGLDAARAAAILLVLLSHGIGFWSPMIGISSSVRDGLFWLFGLDGVEIFFCLSGFLIGGLLLDIQHRKPSADAVWVFLVRRWLRTLPLYYLVLIALFIFPSIEPSAHERIWSYIPLGQNLVTPMPASNWFGPSWSLTIEEWSYLALPVLAFWAYRHTRNPLGYAALTLCLAGIGVRCAIGLWHRPWDLDSWDLFVRKMVISRSDAIAYGVLVAIFMERYGSRDVKYWLLAPAAVLIGWNVWVCFHFGNIPGFVGVMLLFPSTGIGFAMVLPLLNELPRPPFLSKPVYFLARISYPLYLVHWSFMFIAAHFPESVRFLVFICGSIGVATALSYGIEYPIMRRRPRQI